MSVKCLDSEEKWTNTSQPPVACTLVSFSVDGADRQRKRRSRTMRKRQTVIISGAPQAVQNTTLELRRRCGSLCNVVVFFALTDRASTIPSHCCQSGTWSAGQEKIRGTSTKLKREQKQNKKQNKNDKNKGTTTKYTCQKNIEEGHLIARVWYSSSHEPSDTLPGSQPRTQTHSIYHTPYSQGPVFSNGTVDVA